MTETPTARYYRRAASTDDGTITPDALDGLMEYQEYLCAICGEVPRGLPSFDHIIPLSRGGTHSVTNLQMTCWPCNHRKGSQWPYHRKAPSQIYDYIRNDPTSEWC